jgi:hypothetical protein
MMSLVGILDALRRSGVPDLDPRVAQIANDDSRSIDERQGALYELGKKLTSEHDLQNISGYQETLEMRRRAQAPSADE